MLNVMTDGHYNMQKGKMDVTRHAMLNMAFFGNPPNYWKEDEHKEEEMLAAFGKYTMPIISRLTLIFAKPTLSKGADAQTKIKEKILQNMDKTVSQGVNKSEINNLRTFFREYLKCVSRYHPKLKACEGIVTSEFARIEQTEQFSIAFAKRGKTDYRKWAELLNLVRGFTRLNGRHVVEISDIDNAIDIFQDSLETLTSAFPRSALNQGMDAGVLELYHKLLTNFENGSGQASGTRSEMARYAASLGLKDEWKTLLKMKYNDETPPNMVVDDIQGHCIIKPNWNGDA